MQRMLAAVMWISLAATAPGQVQVKLGTLAPRGTTFHQILLAMGEKWRQAPGGGVRLIVYPGGATGGEADMVRRMKVGASRRRC